jgi:multidrug efflux pump subunit AcrA (membrane-fusion protein)
LVDVVLDGQVVRRAVRTGRLFGGDVEVLSGLQVGEVVVVHRQASSGG